MNVYPLQLGQVDWEIYVKTCLEFLGESPTRGIDSIGIDLKNPSAFLKTLDLHNQPSVAMSQEHLYSHVFFSFMSIVDLFTISQIAERSCLSLAYVEKRNQALIIMSGTLKDWKCSIVQCCNHRAESILRRLFNEIYISFEKAGFKEVWKDYRQASKGDGTFTFGH